jgi:hypothetical protein
MDATRHFGRSRHSGSRRWKALDADLSAMLALAPTATPQDALPVGRNRAEPARQVAARGGRGGLVLPSLRLEGGRS